MRPILTITSFLLNPTLSLAHISFERIYGGPDVDWGYSVQQTQDGGYIITGSTRSFGAGLEDVYLIKTDSLGDTLWTRTYGGGYQDVGLSIEKTRDGGYIISGRTESFGAGGHDVYLLKTDSLGDTLWTKTYGGTLDDVGWSVYVTSDGGYIIAGETWSFGIGSSDVYLIRTDPLGNTLWTKTYGGTSRDGAYSVRETQDGGFIVTGFIACPTAGLCKVYLIKTNPLGEILWTRTYGRPGGNAGHSVQETQDGGFIIAGCTDCWYDYPDVYLIKTDSLGDTLWSRTYGSPGTDLGYSVQQTEERGYIIAGSTAITVTGTPHVYLIKTDSLGDTLWTRTYGDYGPDEGRSVQKTSDGSYIIAGYVNPFLEVWNAYLIKVDIWGPEILSACASDGLIPAPGIDEDDYVLLTFDEPTNKPSIPPMFGVIDSILALSGGHSWRDGMGWIESAIWDSSGTRLQINLRTNGGLPTVAVGDTITPDGVTIKDKWRNPCVKPIVITCSFDPVGVEESNYQLPVSSYQLFQNRPNPFHSSTTIRYTIPGKRIQDLGVRGQNKIPVRLAIYDITGRLVEILVEEMQEPGVYELPISNHQLPGSGIYFYRLQVSQSPLKQVQGGKGDFTQTQKLLLIR